MKLNIRILYLYLFSFVGLIIVVFGSITLVNLGLKTFIFKEADKYSVYYDETMPQEKQVISKEEQEKRQNEDLVRQRQRELSNAIAMIAVGTPLYLYHWKKIQKEDKA